MEKKDEALETLLLCLMSVELDSLMGQPASQRDIKAIFKGLKQLHPESVARIAESEKLTPWKKD